jgi:hypothetical protein
MVDVKWQNVCKQWMVILLLSAGLFLLWLIGSMGQLTAYASTGNITISTGANSNITETSGTIRPTGSTAAVVNVTYLQNLLNAGTDVTVESTGGSITLSNAVSTSGTGVGGLTLRAPGQITLNASITLTGTGANDGLTVLSQANITNDFGNNTTFTTAGTPILFSADTNNAGGGNIYWESALTLTSNGGNITLAGGDLTGSGYSTGIGGGNLAEGVRIKLNFTANSSGGNITLRGRSATPSNALGGAWGLSFDQNCSINSGTGKIYIEGISQSTKTDAYSGGLWFGAVRGTSGAGSYTTTITSANTASDAIVLRGDSSTAANAGWNAGILNYSAMTVTATGTGGGITMRGKRNASGNPADVYFGLSARVLANSGPIQIIGESNGGGLYIEDIPNTRFGYASGTSVTSSTSNITFQMDKYNWTSNGSLLGIQTTGAFAMIPVSSSFQTVNNNWFSFPSTLSG